MGVIPPFLYTTSNFLRFTFAPQLFESYFFVGNFAPCFFMLVGGGGLFVCSRWWGYFLFVGSVIVLGWLLYSITI